MGLVKRVRICLLTWGSVSEVAGARNDLPANRSLSFCFEIPI